MDEPTPNTKNPKPLSDVAAPGTVPPSSTTKSIIGSNNGSMVRDPMLVARPGGASSKTLTSTPSSSADKSSDVDDTLSDETETDDTAADTEELAASHEDIKNEESEESEAENEPVPDESDKATEPTDSDLSDTISSEETTPEPTIESDAADEIPAELPEQTKPKPESEAEPGQPAETEEEGVEQTPEPIDEASLVEAEAKPVVANSKHHRGLFFILGFVFCLVILVALDLALNAGLFHVHGVTPIRHISFK